MLDILKWIFAAFLLASSCWAAPVPPSGFKFLGQPAFASGLFRGLDASSSSVAAHTIDGYIQQTRLYSTMQSQIVRAMSYQCVSSNTWIALLNSTTYVSAGVPPVNTLLCSVLRLNGNLLRIAYTLASNGVCPGIEHLPSGSSSNNTVVISANPFIVQMSFLRLPSTTAPSQNECFNASTSTIFTTPLTSDPPPTPSGTPCEIMPVKGGPANVQGVWSNMDGSVGLIEAKSGWASASWSAVNLAELSGMSASYRSYECIDEKTSNAASFWVRRFLNGTVTTGWSCENKVRLTTGDGDTTLTVQARDNSTATESIILQAPVAFAHETTCAVPISCNYSGVYFIKPRFHPCDGHFLSYFFTNCSNPKLSLLKREQLGGVNRHVVWRLNSTWNGPTQKSTPTNIVSMRKCAAANLGRPGSLISALGASAVKMTPGNFKFKAVPVKNDCSVVNLVALNGPNGLNYLSVPGTCDAFTWEQQSSGRTRFQLDLREDWDSVQPAD